MFSLPTFWGFPFPIHFISFFSSDMSIYHLVFGPMYAAFWEFLVATFQPG